MSDPEESIDVVESAVKILMQALRFYADGHHLGPPLHEDVEDGAIARDALQRAASMAQAARAAEAE